MKTKLFVLFLFVMVLTNCGKKEDITSDQPKLAVKCILKTNQFAKAYLENSVSLQDSSWLDSFFDNDYSFDNQPHYVNKSAKVNLFKNGIWVDSLIYNPSTYLYEGVKHKIEPQATYKIEITVKGLPLIFASCTIPQIVKISALDTSSDYSFLSYNSYPNTCQLKFNDPSEEENFYEIIGLGDIKSMGIPLKSYPIFFRNIPLFESKSYYNMFHPYFSDKTFNGKTISIPLQGVLGDSIFSITLANISNEEFQRIKAINQWYLNYNNAFVEPVVIYSNIKNGVGIFAGMAISSDTIRIKKNL